MDAGDRQVVRLDRSEVAGRLRVDQLSERVRPTRDREVVGVVRCELEEPAGGWPALVQLAGRVEEPRPVAGRRRAARSVAEERADARDRLVALGRRSDERL